MADIDTTFVAYGNAINNRWRCPHCGQINTISQDAAGMLAQYDRYLEHCEKCNCLHWWRMKRSADNG